jgi:pilus assembly protein CpaB
LLQHTQPLASDDAIEQFDGPSVEPAKEADSGIERRRHPRVRLETPSPDEEWGSAAMQERRQNDRRKADPSAYTGVERRKGERRSMESLRTEVPWTLAPEIENRILSGLRPKGGRGLGMKPARLALLLVAVLAGGLAAFLATQRSTDIVVPAQEVVQVAKVQVLVAREVIGIGQRLTPNSVAWEYWPEDLVRSDYVTDIGAPDAISDMNGALARFEFFPGEPIREQKLARDAQGYLSAVIGKGMRGVSISVAAESASGGFILPNDHVDVVLTRTAALGQISETILHNVRVLAINTRLGETGTTGAPANPEDPEDPRAEIFVDEAIATLELDPNETEVIVGAAQVGSFALVLRSMVDFSESAKSEQSGTNQAIRISSPFWNQSDLQARVQ